MSRLAPLLIDAVPEPRDCFAARAKDNNGVVVNSLLIMQRKPKLVKAFTQMVAATFDPEGEVAVGFKRLPALVAHFGFSKRWNDTMTTMRSRSTTVYITMLAIAASYALCSQAAADAYPVRPIRLIVTAAAGGNADTVARLTGQYLAEGLHQPVVIDNRPGANSMLATEMTVRAAPDGYTLVLVSNAHATNPSLVRKMPYDTLKDLAPISLLATTSNVLVVNPSVGANSVKELIAIAKARPGQLNYGSSGNGSSANLAAELFNSLAGVRITQVPYKGTSQLLTDVISGQIQLSFSSMASIMPHVKAGKLKALGVTGVKRSPAAPDVPTIAEAGVAGYRSINWNGLLAPAATPKHIIVTLNREIVTQFKTPGAQERFASVGIEALYGSPAEFDTFIREEIKQWGKVIKQAGIKVDLE